MARIDRVLLPRSASTTSTSLVNLLTGDCFKSEIALLRVTCLKTSLRFRSSHSTRLLAQTCSSLRCVAEVSTDEIRESINELDDPSKKGKLDVAVKLLKTIQKCGEHSSRCLKLILWSFSETIRWLKVGHLTPHLLTLVSLLSRLRFILKAIIYYSNELYKDIYSVTKIIGKERLTLEEFQTSGSLDHLIG